MSAVAEGFNGVAIAATSFAMNASQTCHRVVGGHEFVEIKPLDGADLVLDARDVIEPRRLDGMAQGARAFRLQMLLEISERGMLRIGRHFMRDADGRGFARR